VGPRPTDHFCIVGPFAKRGNGECSLLPFHYGSILAIAILRGKCRFPPNLSSVRAFSGP
jgi:hypothetical protein